VGLIAVNVLGDETDAVTASNGKLSSPVTEGQAQGGDVVAPYDDLAFQMYVDQDSAAIIRDMETKKMDAVRGESIRALVITKPKETRATCPGNSGKVPNSHSENLKEK
jgi:hypothetical protein